MDVSKLRGSLNELIGDVEVGVEASGHKAMIEYVISVFEKMEPGESAASWVAQWRVEWDWLCRHLEPGPVFSSSPDDFRAQLNLLAVEQVEGLNE